MEMWWMVLITIFSSLKLENHSNLFLLLLSDVCTGSALGPTGSTGRSRTMSTSVLRTPCAPPLDSSEPRHARQSGLLLAPPSALALDVPPPPCRPVSTCLPPLFSLSPTVKCVRTPAEGVTKTELARRQAARLARWGGTMRSRVVAAADLWPSSCQTSLLSPFNFFPRFFFFFFFTPKDIQGRRGRGCLGHWMWVCVCLLDVCVSVEAD